MSKTDDTLKALQKVYGENIISHLNTNSVLDKEFVSTGSLKLNRALSGGLVRGRTVELFGGFSAGKSTLALHLIKKHQEIGNVLYVDTEHSFDPEYAKNIGVNVDTLLFSQPDFAEQAFEIIEAIAATGEFSLIVLDSVAACSPRAEFVGDSGDSNMGLGARLLGQHLRKVTPIASNNKCTILYINQIRMKIGVMFGSPETTPMGNALKFFTSVRMDIRKIASIKKDGEPIGIQSRIRVVKNKTAPPLKEAVIDIYYGKGIDHDAEILDFAVEQGVITKKGSWYSYGDEKLGQGRESCLAKISDNQELRKELLSKLVW